METINETLKQMVEDMNNDHYVDYLEFYANRCRELEEQFDLALKDMAHILKTTDADICEYCKHYCRCSSKECDAYISGVGDVDGKWPTLEWTCMDTVYGTCPKLKNTSCNGCFQNDYSGFEWRGKVE